MLCPCQGCQKFKKIGTFRNLTDACQHYNHPNFDNQSKLIGVVGRVPKGFHEGKMACILNERSGYEGCTYLKEWKIRVGGSSAWRWRWLWTRENPKKIDCPTIKHEDKSSPPKFLWWGDEDEDEGEGKPQWAATGTADALKNIKTSKSEVVKPASDADDKRVVKECIKFLKNTLKKNL